MLPRLRSYAYSLAGDKDRAIRKLDALWASIAAVEPWDRFINQALMSVMTLRDLMVLHEVSPYHMPPWGEDQFREILNEHFDFDEMRKLARRPGAPRLHIGAVEVLSGHFEVFTGEDFSVEREPVARAVPREEALCQNGNI